MKTGSHASNLMGLAQSALDGDGDLEDNRFCPVISGAKI